MEFKKFFEKFRNGSYNLNDFKTNEFDVSRDRERIDEEFRQKKTSLTRNESH